MTVAASDEPIWLLITTAVALVAGGISGWVSAAFRRREKRKERIRDEVLRWANPVLGAVTGLESRLTNILDDGLFVALDPRRAGEERPVDEDWAIGYEYALESTLFLFAEYFAWIRLLQERLSFELFETQETKDRFFDAIWDVSNALSRWPDEKVMGGGSDAQVFVLQQRAIGELLVHREEERPRVLSYPEFLAARESDARFDRVLAPLASLLTGVRPQTKRWQRLEGTRLAVGGLRQHCDQLLGLERAR
jgi:hypothetical protein